LGIIRERKSATILRAHLATDPRKQTRPWRNSVDYPRRTSRRFWTFCGRYRPRGIEDKKAHEESSTRGPFFLSAGQKAGDTGANFGLIISRPWVRGAVPSV